MSGCLLHIASQKSLSYYNFILISLSSLFFSLFFDPRVEVGVYLVGLWGDLPTREMHPPPHLTAGVGWGWGVGRTNPLLKGIHFYKGKHPSVVKLYTKNIDLFLANDEALQQQLSDELSHSYISFDVSICDTIDFSAVADVRASWGETHTSTKASRPSRVPYKTYWAKYDTLFLPVSKI